MEKKVHLTYYLPTHDLELLYTLCTIVWYNAQGDKMPKYDKMPKVKMPKWHFVQVWQNAQGDKMPKRHYAQDDKMPKMSFCPKWQNAIPHSTRVQPSDDLVNYPMISSFT